MSQRWNSTGKTAAAGTTVAFATPCAKGGVSVIDSLVVESGNTAHTITCLRAYDRTVTTAGSTSNTNTVTVSSATIGTGFTPGTLAANDWVALRMLNGSIFVTTVNAVNTTTKVVTLNANTSTAFGVGADFWMYGTASNTGRHHLVGASTANTSVEVFPLGSFFAARAPDSPIIVHNANATNASTHWCSGRIVPTQTAISAHSATASADTAFARGLGGAFDAGMDVTGLVYTVAGTGHTLHFMTPLSTTTTGSAMAAAETVVILPVDVGLTAGLDEAAAGDFIGIELNDRTMHLSTIGSYSANGDVFDVEIDDLIPVGSSVRLGAKVWYFGLTTDGHVNWETGTSNTTNWAESSKMRMPPNTPIVVHSDNITAAGRLVTLSGTLRK